MFWRKGRKRRDCKVGRMKLYKAITWDKLKKLRLDSEWRFEDGDWKFDSCSTKSEYKNKFKEGMIT